MTEEEGFRRNEREGKNEDEGERRSKERGKRSKDKGHGGESILPSL